MRQRFILFRRRATFYAEDTTTGHQVSLRTKSKAEALSLLNAKNESHRQPSLNLHIARTYLAAVDPEIAKRAWRVPMEEIAKLKKGPTSERYLQAMRDPAFDLIRDIPILETQATHFLQVLEKGTVSTNVFLRRIHNFAVDMNWLPWPLLPKKRWPKLNFKDKRAITLEEHERIVAREPNTEMRLFYQLLWHLGGAQSDVANLRAEDVDREQMVISYVRRKTGIVSLLHFSASVVVILDQLPKQGPLFPRLAEMHEKHRAKEFNRRCKGLKISGVTLHSYRYAWAERAKRAGMPERFAQEALGHNSKAIHRAYSRRAQVNVPSLEEYEKSAKETIVSAGFGVAAVPGAQ